MVPSKAHGSEFGGHLALETMSSGLSEKTSLSSSHFGVDAISISM